MSENASGRTAVVWVEPIERGDLRLAPGDIQEALMWFKDKTEQEPRRLLVNLKENGVLMFLIRLSKEYCQVKEGEFYIWITHKIDLCFLPGKTHFV